MITSAFPTSTFVHPSTTATGPRLTLTTQMLAAFSQVDIKSGSYIKPINDKLGYATMVFIRSGIVQNAGMVLARAATVAVRYCAVRRQFADKDITDNSAGEIQGEP